MQLLGRVILLAACVLTAYAIPNIKRSILSQRACLKHYMARQDEINYEINTQTAACNRLSNQTGNATDEEIAAEIRGIRSNLTTLQDNISDCMAITNNLTFVQCVQNCNDVNVNLLNNAQKSAKYVEGEINNSTSTAEGNRIKCIEKVILDGSQNFTQASDDLNRCLLNVTKQIELY